MSICCLFLPLCLQNKIYFQFQLPHKKILVKILGFEVSFKQIMDKVRRNIKLNEYLASVKLD